MTPRIDCVTVSGWIQSGRSNDTHGVCLIDYMAMPAGLRAVITVNDGDPSSRRILRSLHEIVALPNSCISLAVRNESLIPWRIGFSGKSGCGQVWFRTNDGTEDGFGVAGAFEAGISYGETRAECGEIRVELDTKTIAHNNREQPTSVKGNVEFGDHTQFPPARYSMHLR